MNINIIFETIIIVINNLSIISNINIIVLPCSLIFCYLTYVEIKIQHISYTINSS
jgi:hypothetical protein